MHAAAGARPDWIFDLDNTLYATSTGLYDQIDRRMGDYIAQTLDLSPARARRVQKDYYHRYGTTLRGLRERHNIDAAHFMDFVHDIDHDVLVPDAALERALAAAGRRRFVFTNGSLSHAERVLAALGIAHLFDGIFDMAHADYMPKPEPAAYEAMFAHFGISGRRALMVDDMKRNLKPAAERGVYTVWLKTDYPWASLSVDEARPPYVHAEIEALVPFLEAAGKYNGKAKDHA